MTFNAQIFDASKRLIGAVSFDTWAEAAQKLRESTHPHRKFSSILIVDETAKVESVLRP